MGLFNTPLGKTTENKQIFRPYHHLGLFDRTFSSAKRGEGVICAMLCVGSIEAYINDIEGWYSYVGANFISFHKDDHVSNNYLNDDERRLTENLKTGESLSMVDKLQLFGHWSKTEKLYQEFQQLIAIRNGLTHLKAEELSICKETGNYTGYPKFLNNLIQKKIIVKPKQAVSWIESLENREFCLWCQDIAYQVIQRLTKMLPETPVKNQFSTTAYFFFDKDNFRERYSWQDKA